MSGAPDLSVRDAVDRWLDHLRLDKADQTVADYGRRLKHFVEWCDTEGYESLQEIGGWEVDTYATHRRGNDLHFVVTLRFYRPEITDEQESCNMSGAGSSV